MAKRIIDRNLLKDMQMKVVDLFNKEDIHFEDIKYVLESLLEFFNVHREYKSKKIFSMAVRDVLGDENNKDKKA